MEGVQRVLESVYSVRGGFKLSTVVGRFGKRLKVLRAFWGGRTGARPTEKQVPPLVASLRVCCTVPAREVDEDALYGAPWRPEGPVDMGGLFGGVSVRRADSPGAVPIWPL